MRINGADWFVDDIQTLLPDFDDFDEDILQDEAVEEFGLTGDEESESEQATAMAVETDELTEDAAEYEDEGEEELLDEDDAEY